MIDIGYPEWEEPKICIGCERDPCTEDPFKCLDEHLGKLADDWIDRYVKDRGE